MNLDVSLYKKADLIHKNLKAGKLTKSEISEYFAESLPYLVIKVSNVWGKMSKISEQQIEEFKVKYIKSLVLEMYDAGVEIGSVIGGKKVVGKYVSQSINMLMLNEGNGKVLGILIKNGILHPKVKFKVINNEDILKLV